MPAALLLITVSASAAFTLPEKNAENGVTGHLFARHLFHLPTTFELEIFCFHRSNRFAPVLMIRCTGILQPGINIYLADSS